MIPVSAQGRKILQAGSYTWDCRVDIIDHNGSTVLAKDVPVSDGTISWDIQRTAGHSVANLVIADPWVNLPGWDTKNETLVPKSTNSPLAPFGHRARITISVSDGGLWESFTFPDRLILDTRVDRPTGAITVECVDMAFMIHQLKLASRVVVPLNSDVWNHLSEFYREAMSYFPLLDMYPPGIGRPKAPFKRVFNVLGDEKERPNSSYWEMMVFLARDIDSYLRTKGSKGLEIIPIPGWMNSTSATINTGPGGEIISMTSEINRAEVINGIYVFLEAEWRKPKPKKNKPNNKVKKGFTGGGFASITTGPLKYGGQMGTLTKVYRESGGVFDTKQDIIDAAYRIAHRYLANAQEAPGLARALTANCVPMPWLQVFDHVAVKFPSGGTEKYMVKAVEHSLNPAGSNSGTTVRFWWDEDGANLDPVLYPFVAPLTPNTFLAGEGGGP